MAFDLVNNLGPIRWTQADAATTRVLEDLQGNILKGHGREQTRHIFVSFNANHALEAKSFIKWIGGQVTNALDQLRSSAEFKKTRKSAPTFKAMFLTASGYAALGLKGQCPNDPAFLAGMAARGTELNDPTPVSWDAGYGPGRIHAMVLLADSNIFALAEEAHAIITAINKNKGVDFVHEESGHGMKNVAGNNIEHFGYVDGRSVPILLEEDMPEQGGIDQWDPRASLKIALIDCPGGIAGQSYGSYFVFRKLEQNVKGFKRAEADLAKTLKLEGEDKERSGAMVIGRFENGTPLALQADASSNPPAPAFNNYNYDNDKTGSLTPLQAHTRKSNPRGEGGFESPQDQRRHLMVRRGITYGTRDKHPNDPTLQVEQMPSAGVGLLFMAYQASIENQFEFTQKIWVNNPSFSKAKTGLDPVIGQGKTADRTSAWPTTYGGQAMQAASFPGKPDTKSMSAFVTLKGGEYFYAPSMHFLKNI